MYFILSTYLYFKNAFVYMKDLIFTRTLAVEAPQLEFKNTGVDDNCVQTEGKYTSKDNVPLSLPSQVSFNSSQNEEHEKCNESEFTDGNYVQSTSSLPPQVSFNDSSQNEEHEKCSTINESTESTTAISKSVNNKVTPYESPLKILFDALIKTNENHFKMPGMPIKRIKIKHRNTVSPVAMYIKYSPRAPLVTNVKTADLSPKSLKRINDEIQTFKSDNIPLQSLMQNDIDLPDVFYKPSKLQVRNFEEKMKLPPSYSRLIPINPTVIKHEKIIYKQVMSPQVILNILEKLEKNLKCDEDAESDLDTSIWTMFRAYKGASGSCIIKN